MVSTGLCVEPLFGVSIGLVTPEAYSGILTDWGFISVLRGNILKHYYEDQATLKQRTYASTISGGVAGGAVTKLMGTYLPSLTLGLGVKSRVH